jgi:hypothetical protein
MMIKNTTPDPLSVIDSEGTAHHFIVGISVATESDEISAFVESCDGLEYLPLESIKLAPLAMLKKIVGTRPVTLEARDRMLSLGLTNPCRKFLQSL